MAVSQAQTFSLMPKTAMAASWKLEGSRAISWYLWFTSIGRTQQVNIWKWGTNFKRSSSISSGEGTGHQYRYLHVTSTVTSWVFHSTLAHVIELNLLRRGLQKISSEHSVDGVQKGTKVHAGCSFLLSRSPIGVPLQSSC